MTAQQRPDLTNSEPATSRDVLGKLLRYIPGFSGYADSAAIRTTDERSRAFLADRLGQCKQSLENLSRQWIDAGDLDHLPQLDRIRGRIDLLIARLRAGVSWGAKSSDPSQLDETRLQDLLDLDLELVTEVDRLSAFIGEQSSQPPVPAIPQMNEQLSAFTKNLDRRSALLRGDDQP